MRWAVAVLLLAGCSVIVPGPGEFEYTDDDAGRDGGDAVDAGPAPEDGGPDAGPPGSDGGGCMAGEDRCLGACVDTMTSADHCGRCENACGTGEVCRAGECFDPVVEVSSGPTHNCALRASGDVMCWGQNEVGQIGDGSILMRSAPVPITLHEPSEQVAAGGFAFSSGTGFTCERNAAGEMSCWGEQQGDTPLIQSTSPEPFTALSGVTFIAVGYGVGCAILTGRRLSCWGTLAFDTTVMPPTQLEPGGLSGAWVQSVSVGSGHLCATSTDQRVFCMGDNASGQLGRDPASLPDTTAFVAVAGINDAEEVTVNGAISCVRRTSGRVSCWGAEDRLGIGSTTAAPHPMPEDVPGIDDAQSIHGGAGLGAGTCALRADGTVSCWGWDFRENPIGNPGAASPYAVPDAIDVASVGVGTSHLCVVLTDGTAKCVGRNFWGTLGDGSETDSTTFVDVVLP